MKAGNVGIGTTSPSQLLTVGNNNQFTVDSSGNVVIKGTTTFSNNATFYTNGYFNLNKVVLRILKVYSVPIPLVRI